jgi:hypothetical protein
MACGVIIRFSRYRFRDGSETQGAEVLRRHVAALKAAEGCEDAWLAQGQHPSTEFIVVARFRDPESARNYEGRLRSDIGQSGDFFSLLRLTKQPPEITQYELA